jgi:hypothetical protein
VRKADNLPPSCADVRKSEGLNFLEPCGPVQACNGTAAAYVHHRFRKSLPLLRTLKQIISLHIAFFCSLLQLANVLDMKSVFNNEKLDRN